MDNTIDQADLKYLKQALRLAKRGLGKTFPNPMVGAIIVHRGKVIGQGYHRRAGLPHAEIEALRAAKVPVQGATLYVNLEPCSHQGKTPPCVAAIIEAGLSRVVCCTPDPNSIVSGKGIAQLRQARIDVSVGGLAEEARSLNEAFFGFHKHHRPFIAIKFAASLDGKIATRTHDSKWITNPAARRYARNLRSQYQAVLVGINTVLRDNPHLGSPAGKSDPLRIILDNTLRLPLQSQILRDDNVLIITSQLADPAKLAKLGERGFQVFACRSDQILLPEVMKELRAREIISVFVEGGGTVLGSFVDAGLVDKVYGFYAPLLIGGTDAVSAINGQGTATISSALQVSKPHYRKFGDNILISGNTYP